MVHLSVRASGTFVIKKLSQKHLFHYPSSWHIASNKCRSQTTFVSNISHCAGMDGEVFTANKLGLETRGHTYPDRPFAQEILLNMISCGCEADGCGVLCGCFCVAVGRLVYTVPPCVQAVVVKHSTM